MHSTQTDSTPPLQYLLVETHSPAQDQGEEFLRMARTLLDSGARVQLHLMQNAVIWMQQARERLAGLASHHPDRLQLSVDDLSMDLRGIPHQCAEGVACVRDAQWLVASMAQASVKTLWHS